MSEPVPIEYTMKRNLEWCYAEIDRLRVIERDRDAVCNSYAAENQRFSDEIDRLRNYNVRAQNELHRLRAENAELLRCISNAAARCSDEATVITLRSILAKTAREGD